MHDGSIDTKPIHCCAVAKVFHEANIPIIALQQVSIACRWGITVITTSRLSFYRPARIDPFYFQQVYRSESSAFRSTSHCNLVIHALTQSNPQLYSSLLRLRLYLELVLDESEANLILFSVFSLGLVQNSKLALGVFAMTYSQFVNDGR